MKKFEIFQELPKCTQRQKVSKHYFEKWHQHCAMALHRVATNLQFLKNSVSAKHNKVKHNKTRHAYTNSTPTTLFLGEANVFNPRKWQGTKKSTSEVKIFTVVLNLYNYLMCCTTLGSETRGKKTSFMNKCKQFDLNPRLNCPVGSISNFAIDSQLYRFALKGQLA